MANVLTVPEFGVRVEEREKRVRYNVALSGSYVQGVRLSNVGEVLDLTNIVNTGDQAGALWGNRGPSSVYIINTGSTGYAMSITPGGDAWHWLLRIYSALATELAAGTYAANAATLLADLDIAIEASGRYFD